MSSVAEATEGHILQLKIIQLISLFKPLQRQVFMELSRVE